MIDLDDREDNFTVAENVATGLRIPEYTLRQLLGWSLQEIGKSVDALQDNLIDQLFVRLGKAVTGQIRDWIRRHPNIETGVNWPRHDVALPYIAVVNEGSSEDASLSMLGDHSGNVSVLGVSGRAITKKTISERNTSTVYVMTDDPNLTLYLSTLVHYIIVSNKLSLLKYHDLHDLVVAKQDVRWDERFGAVLCYVRAVQLTYSTFFDFNVTEKAATTVSLDLLVATRNADEEIIVSVPSGESA